MEDDRHRHGRLLVLMYHGVHRSSADPGRFDPRYSVTPAAFGTQMVMLKERCGQTWLPPPDTPFRLPAAGTTSPMITFDDGDVSNARVALGCLQRLGLRAAFFVTSDFIGQPGMLSRLELRELADAGMAIGSHGASHRFLSTLSERALAAELAESRDVLEQLSGRPVRWLALPGGRGGARELQAAQAAGYDAVFGSVPGDNRDLPPGQPLQRVAITRGLDDAGFVQVLDWGGPVVRRLVWRHSLLAMPKRVLGDDRYDRLRQALVR